MPDRHLQVLPHSPPGARLRAPSQRAEVPGYFGILPTGSDALAPVQRPRKGIPDKHPEGHKIYPYLLEDVEVTHINHEWSTDITYIRMAEAFVYLVAGRDARQGLGVYLVSITIGHG